MLTGLRNDTLKIGVYHWQLLLMESNVSGREVAAIAGLAGPGGILPCSLGSDGLTRLVCGIQPFLGLRDELDLVTARDDCHFHTLNVSDPFNAQDFCACPGAWLELPCASFPCPSHASFPCPSPLMALWFPLLPLPRGECFFPWLCIPSLQPAESSSALGPSPPFHPVAQCLFLHRISGV